ncbi:hypothetical protein [Streptomyces lydicus]|uniref:hypothetical protein n=1 Tax=Streptomyces lydicus TaxID=47763 RepID=UPI0013E332EB
MVRARIALVTVTALLLPGAARADAPPSPPPSPPPLTDDRGRTLTLRGWNVEDKMHRGADALSAITERHFRDLHDQGFNFARLLVFWDDLEPRPGHYSSRYLRKIERILNWAHQWRIQVVVGEWGPRDSSLPHMARFYGDALASLDRYSSGWAGYVWCYGGGYCAVDKDGRFQANKEQTARPYAHAVAGTVREQRYDATTRTFHLVYDSSGRPGVSELSTPPTATGWQVSVHGPAVARPRVVPAGERGTVRIWTRPGASGRVTVTVSARE